MFQIVEIEIEHKVRFIRLKLSGEDIIESEHCTPWADTKANREIRTDTAMAFKVGDPVPPCQYMDKGVTSYTYDEIKTDITPQYKDYPEYDPTEATLQEYITKLDGLGVMIIKPL